MAEKIRLIAFDLDGTLLDDGKALPERNRRALEAAGEAGIWLVPATGRIPAGMPEPLRGLKGLRWGILSNGAEIYDFEEERIVVREEIALDTALELLDHAEALGLYYDCYQDNWGYMTASLLAQAPAFMKDYPGILDLLLRLRTPVPELRAWLREKGERVQKLQMYFTDLPLRERLLRELPERFPSLSFTSSLPVNIEINSTRANKGQALRTLCSLLGLRREETLAFGDGSNDLTLLREAGIGVAMSNAFPDVLAAADRVTGTNNDAGVAQVIEEVLS